MRRVRVPLKQKLQQQFSPKNLSLNVYGEDPGILNWEGSYVEGLSKKLNQGIQSMKLSAKYQQATALSANQVSVEHNIFVMQQNVKQWSDPFLSVDDYDVFINPRIVGHNGEIDQEWEFCASHYNLKCKVQRFKSIYVEYQDELFNDKQKQFDGFEARVIQHEVDHLLGYTMLDWRINQGEIYLLEEAKKAFFIIFIKINYEDICLKQYFHNNNCKQYFKKDFQYFDKALELYRETINKTKKDFPNIFEMKKIPINISDQIWFKYDIKDMRKSMKHSMQNELYRKLQKSVQKDLDIINTKHIEAGQEI